MKIGQVKILQSSKFLTRFSCFFLEYSVNCCKPLANINSFENIDFDSFCQCSHCFLGRVDFQGSLSAILANIMLSFIITSYGDKQNIITIIITPIHLQMKKVGIYIFFHCYNKFSETQWLKATQICYFTVLQVEIWHGFHQANIKVLAGQFLSGLFKKKSFPCSFRLFLTVIELSSLFPYWQSAEGCSQLLHGPTFLGLQSASSIF